MRYLTALALTLAACTSTPDTSSTMPRTQACQEQADAWCEHAGYPSNGCQSWYLAVHCEQHGPDGVVLESAQNACLDAIAESVPTWDGYVEPEACQGTWN